MRLAAWMTDPEGEGHTGHTHAPMRLADMHIRKSASYHAPAEVHMRKTAWMTDPEGEGFG
jgi:hypothetical protein